MPGILRESATATAFLVFDERANGTLWQGMEFFSEVFDAYNGTVADIMTQVPNILPEDNALVMFTSGASTTKYETETEADLAVHSIGTTGMPKGVLSTQRQFLTNIPNVMVGSLRAAIRAGGEYPDLNVQDDPQKGLLIGVPLFHVTGLTSFTMLSTLMGMKIVLTPKWVVEEGEFLFHLSFDSGD
ncbi:hypothetical protein H0H81_008431 [Sphagnurus paluster]|uniref:AMP-dependent synthetase/ligase domain-containing protein n=1 Tax=Sphagnurus paluster TaxID=117069 RepID=A0A9P7FPX3_9AGAR|nr:hypothetical protein H0H81_008431 [Sphagnurus paluster]